MKVKKECEVVACDFCGHNHTFNKCILCGKDVCWNCETDPTKVKAFDSGVYLVSSLKDVICLSCYKKAKEAGDKLLLAYEEIERLRNEYNGWHEQFDVLRNKAENNLRKIKKERKIES